MFGNIALFELRYQLRRPIALVSFLIFAMIAYGVAATSGTDKGIIPMNAPWRLIITLAFFSVFAMFLSLATFADVALRDGNSRMDEIMRAQPVRKTSYLGAKFAGAFAVAVFTFLGIVFGYALGVCMPWVPAASAGPFRLEGYAVAIATIVLPNLFVTGALFFTVAKLTRSLMASYLSALILLVILIATPFLLLDPAYRTWAVMLDPFGIFAFIADTYGWTAAERSNLLLPLDGLFVWNWLLWIGVGSLLLALSFTVFNPRERRPRVRHVPSAGPATKGLVRARPVLSAGGAGFWDQLVLRTRHETRSILRSWTFIVLLILGVTLSVLVLLALIFAGRIPRPPLTDQIASAVTAAIWLVAVLIPIAYGGELIWRDRKAKIAEIIDATPTPTAVFFASKIAGVGLVIVSLLAAAMATGIVVQLMNGSRAVNVGYFVTKLLLEVGLPALMYGVLAIFIQTLVNRKFVGLLLTLTALLLVGLAPDLGVTSKLLQPFYIPAMALFDFFLQGEISARTLWFVGYWTSISVLIATISYLLWVRGAGSLWSRIRRARLAVNHAVVATAVTAVAGTAATAGYIYWNAMS